MDAYTFSIVDPDGRPSNDDGSQGLSQGLRDGLASPFQLYNYSQEHYNSSPRNPTDLPYLTSYTQPGALKSPTGGISGTMAHLSPNGHLGSDLPVDNAPHFLGHQRHFGDSDLGFVSRPTIHISTNFGPSASFTPSPQSAYYSGGEFPSTASSHLSLPPTPDTPYGGTEPILFQGRTLEFDVNSPMIPFRYDDILSAGIDPMLLLDPFTAHDSSRGRTMASERHSSSHTVTQKSRPRSWGPIDSDDTRQRHPVSQRVSLSGALNRKAKRPQRSRSPAALPHLTNFPLDPIDDLFDEEEETQPSLLFEATGSPQSESPDLAANVTIELPLAHSAVLASNRSPDSFVIGLNGDTGSSHLQERSGTIVRSIVASEDVVIASKSRRTVGGPLFKCEVEGCGRDFTAKHNLKNHMNAHYGIKAFVCEHCEKTYTTKHVLTRHSKTCKKLRTKRKGLSTKQ